MSDIVKVLARIATRHGLDKRLKKIDPYSPNLSTEEKALVFQACRISEEYFANVVRYAPSSMRLVKPDLVTGCVRSVTLTDSDFEGTLLKVLRESDIMVAALEEPSLQAWLFDSGDLAVLVSDPHIRRGVKLFIKTDYVVITRGGAKVVDCDILPKDLATLFDCDWVA